MNINDYFARQKDDALAKTLATKIDEFEKFIETTGRLELVKQSYQYFYNLQAGSTLTKSGSSGEILKVSLNEYRSQINAIHVAVANTKPNFKSEATTQDYEAQSQCLMNDAILQHYLEDGLETHIIQAPLMALVEGESFLEVDWDESAGDPIKNPQTGEEIFPGGPRMRLHNGLNVSRDVNLRDGEDYNWIIVRSFENKWLLASKYKEHAEHILAQSETSQRRSVDSIYNRIRGVSGNKSDTIEVFRFYHNPVKTLLPQGKQALMIGGKMVEQLPLTLNYKRIPVQRLAYSQMEGTLLPYSAAWDLLPIMAANNMLLTAAVSNAANLALTSIWTPTGADNQFSMKQLAGGFTHITSQVKPEPLVLAANSPEIWNTLGQLQQRGNQLMGQNSISRGDLASASGIKSGTALATMLASATQVQNQLSQRWRHFSEGSANLLLEVLQKNAKAPLMISIVGRNQGATLKAFTNNEISMVRRVRAELVSPILSTQAGKLELANNLLQQFPTIMDPTKYINVLTTGRMEGLIAPTYDQNMACLAESDAIRQGKKVKVLFLERHDLFIKENLKLISSPEAKEDDGLVDRVRDIVLQRLDFWTQLDQDLQLATLVGIPPVPQKQLPLPPADVNQAPSNPGMPQEGEAANPSALPKAADESLQSAYEQTGIPGDVQN